MIRNISDGLIILFLLGNLVIRFGTIFNYPPFNGVIAGFLGVVIAACVFVVIRPKYLKHLLFIFGFSFFLFGFGSPDIQSRVFELIVTCVASTLFVVNYLLGVGREALGVRGQGNPLNRPLVILLWCYVALSAFSLLLLPVQQIVKDLWFFGFPDAFFYLFTGPLYGIYLPVTAVMQLALFVILAIQLSFSSFRVELYKSFFIGIFSGAVFCAFIGLLDFYGVIPLAWYRFGKTESGAVLHSTFQNRNCFGEFVLTVIPFVMIGFLSKIRGIWWKVFLFGCLVICEIALILAGGRAGWVTYPLILFICWLFSYFTKEGRLQSFHFRLRDLVKVVVSVPVTIVISLLLIFCVLMPLGEQLKNKTSLKGINRGSEGTSRYLKSRIKTIGELDPAGRDRTWGQGFNVGKESPVFGMGYESFFWHGNILTKVPESYFSKFCGDSKRIYESPHNVLISIFVSGGIVGLCLWLLLIGYAVIVMIFDLIENKRLLNIPVIISIISFHMYGMVQSMQYIPMIWLLIFLCLGYAMTLDEGVLPMRLRKVVSKVVVGAMIVVGLSFFFYLFNFESRNLADKYGLDAYAMEQDRDQFAGFYQHSKRWNYGDYRWCGKRGSVTISDFGSRNAELKGGKGESCQDEMNRMNGGMDDKKEDEKRDGSGAVELEFYCRTPGVEEEPVVLSVFRDGKLIDTVTFRKEGSVRRTYEFQAKSSKQKAGMSEQGAGSREQAGEELILEVSRTWVPHEHLGNFDRRKLGMGVKVVSGEQ